MNQAVLSSSSAIGTGVVNMEVELPVEADVFFDEIMQTANLLSMSFDNVTVGKSGSRAELLFTGVKNTKSWIDFLTRRWAPWGLEIVEGDDGLALTFKVKRAEKIMKRGDAARGPLDVDLDNFVAFNAQTPLKLKLLRKIVTGQWVEIRWIDAPNSMALLVNKITKGDGQARVLTPGSDYPFTVELDQIVGAYAAPVPPAMMAVGGDEEPVQPPATKLVPVVTVYCHSAKGRSVCARKEDRSINDLFVVHEGRVIAQALPDGLITHLGYGNCGHDKVSQNLKRASVKITDLYFDDHGVITGTDPEAVRLIQTAQKATDLAA